MEESISGDIDIKTNKAITIVFEEDYTGTITVDASNVAIENEGTIDEIVFEGS